MDPLTIQVLLPYIARLATFFVAIISIAAGVRSISKPIDFATSFGFPPPQLSWRQMSQDTKTPISNEKSTVGDRFKSLRSESESEPSPSTTSTKPSTDSTNPFVPVVGVRNIALGLSILAFTVLDEVHATGVLLLCNLVSMAGDTVLCHRRGTQGSESSHLVATLLFAGLGSYNVLQ
ncbi:hypothetical protein H2204_001626 [Knufia peltigerae]|uniref:Uncharacterized protein n=1 Tax=Knufia peltigerae TaxID=1002370 RepID=A0AA38YCL7_9EURO|nr:hypothetical protein H2204_001626 [Knufia peltigerae]